MNNKIKRFLESKQIQTICKFFVGGIFIYASLSKIVDIDIFIIHIRNFMILPEHLIRVTAYVLPWIELIFGVLLVLNIMTKLSASILSFLLVIFIAALLSASIRGIDINCGCFLHSINRSDYDFSTLTGLYLALRDLLFLIPGMIVIFFKKNAKGIISPP